MNLYIDGRAGIHAALVKQLVTAQFPQWKCLPVVPVEVGDIDNNEQAAVVNRRIIESVLADHETAS